MNTETEAYPITRELAHRHATNFDIPDDKKLDELWDSHKKLEQELTKLSKLVNAPGAWVCDKCSFTLQKSVLNANTGGITANDEPFNEHCPNDGTLMRPATWKEFSESNYKASCDLLDEFSAIEQLVGKCPLHGVQIFPPNADVINAYTVREPFCKEGVDGTPYPIIVEAATLREAFSKFAEAVNKRP